VNRAKAASVVFLLLLTFSLAGGNLLWTERVVQQNHQKYCDSLGQVAHIPVPHPVAGNPSREFAAALEADFRKRDRELGCG
jgi:hypothetical protein